MLGPTPWCEPSLEQKGTALLAFKETHVQLSMIIVPACRGPKNLVRNGHRLAG